MAGTVGTVQQFVECTARLYSLPAVAVEVLRLTSEPRIDVRALKDCIERDPALTTRLLRVVNSSLFGVSRQVSDLNQALALLGIRPLKMLVLGFSLPKDLFAGLEAETLARYWRRTLIKAVASRELAERCWKGAADEAFTAGLLQGIGMLALIQRLGHSYVEFLDRVQAQGGSLLERELESLGFDHVVLSARLLAHWGLPESLCEAIAVQPSEQRIETLPPDKRPLPQVLHLADLLARLVEQPYGPALRDLLECGGRYCGLTYETLQPMVASLQQKVEDLAEVLALELPDGRSYVDLLLESQQRLADDSALVVEMAGPSAEEELLALTVNLRADLETACGGTTRIGPPLRKEPKRTTGNGEGGAIHVAQPAGVNPIREGGPRSGRTAAVGPGFVSAKKAPTGCPPSSTSIDDAGLTGRVTAAIQRCRQLRCPVSLALVQIDAYSDLLMHCGPEKTAELVHAVRFALADWTSQRTAAVMVSDSSLALVWEDCSRSEAVRLARQAVTEARTWFSQRSRSAMVVTLSAGLATIEFPSKNFPANDLIDAAQRCLHGAQLSGGSTVKSIEL
jgi:HD-like signal output (HDOD) protein